MSFHPPHPAAWAAMRQALPLIEQGKIQEAIDIVEPFQPTYIVDCLDTLSEDERSPDDETIENHRQFIVQWVDRIVARAPYGSSAATGLELVSRLHDQYRTHLTYFPDIEWYSRDACLYGAALAQRCLRRALELAGLMTIHPGKAGSELTVARFREYARQVADLDLLPTDTEDAERDRNRGEHEHPHAADKRGPWEIRLRKLAERGEVLDEHGAPVYTLDE